VARRPRYTLAVIVRLDRTIQYSETVVAQSMGRGVLDAPVKPGHDAGDVVAREASAHL
jgi:hypothetical protein